MTVRHAGSATAQLGMRLRPRDAGPGAGPDAGQLLGLAVRRNPRRAQLLVSRVLGKHVPTDPRLVRACGLLLGGLVEDALACRPARELPVRLLHAAVRGEQGAAAAVHAAALRTGVEQAGGADAGGVQAGGAGPGGPRPDTAGRPGPDVLVLGFAETATALGHCVAEALGGADYLHSTRRPVAGVAAAGGFTEEHSHATGHLLLPADPAILRGSRPLVLVDDELSTGRTALNTIAALHRVAPRERYLLATLVDLRPREARELAAGVAGLGAALQVVALATAELELPADLGERAAALQAGALRAGALRAGADAEPGHPRQAGPQPAMPRRVSLTELGWPAGLPAGGRHGFGRAEHRALAGALPGLAARLADAAGLRPGGRTLVLGTEELMHVPLRLAQTLADAGHRVWFSTTSRSPALVVDRPGYALRSGIGFPAHDDPADGPGPRYAYNLGRAGEPPWEHVLVVVDPPADTAALCTGLLAALVPHALATTLVVTP